MTINYKNKVLLFRLKDTTAYIIEDTFLIYIAMKRELKTLKERRNKINFIKMDSASINSWLNKNSKTLPMKENKHVGLWDCPMPWG